MNISATNYDGSEFVSVSYEGNDSSSITFDFADSSGGPTYYSYS
jgi:hypothetical protein